MLMSEALVNQLLLGKSVRPIQMTRSSRVTHQADVSKRGQVVFLFFNIFGFTNYEAAAKKIAVLIKCK